MIAELNVIFLVQVKPSKNFTCLLVPCTISLRFYRQQSQNKVIQLSVDLFTFPSTDSRPILGVSVKYQRSTVKYRRSIGELSAKYRRTIGEVWVNYR